MKRKIVSVQHELIYECAYCDNECEYQGQVIVKWGMADNWRCKAHGDYYIMTSPMLMRGEQIGPTL